MHVERIVCVEQMLAFWTSSHGAIFAASLPPSTCTTRPPAPRHLIIMRNRPPYCEKTQQTLA